jgi:hypothetical protein
MRLPLVIDGITLGGPLQETGIANGVLVFNSTPTFLFSAGAHTIRLDFEHFGGPGTTTILNASIQVRKVAEV